MAVFGRPRATPIYSTCVRAICSVAMFLVPGDLWVKGSPRSRPVKVLRDVVQGEMRCGGEHAGRGSAAKRLLGRKKRQIAGNRPQEPVRRPKRRSPGDALIELVRRFELSKRIGAEAPVIDKDGPAILFLP